MLSALVCDRKGIPEALQGELRIFSPLFSVSKGSFVVRTEAPVLVVKNTMLFLLHLLVGKEANADLRKIGETVLHSGVRGLLVHVLLTVKDAEVLSIACCLVRVLAGIHDDLKATLRSTPGLLDEIENAATHKMTAYFALRALAAFSEDEGFEEDDATLANTAAQCVACAPGTVNTAQPAGDAFLRTCVACGTCGDSVEAGRVASECSPARNITCRACQAHSAPQPQRTLLGPCLCLPGFELAGEDVCTACPVGKFRSTNVNNSVLCEVCADLFYRDTAAGAQCSACTEHCVGAERGSGPEIEVSEEGRVAEQVILPWLASTFCFTLTSEGVNSMLLDVPLCKADHWTSRYTATDGFYYAALSAPPPNRSYPLLCRSSGEEANAADILHAVVWVSDPLYFRSFSGENLTTAQTPQPHETWRLGSFGQFMSSTFAPCVEHTATRAYVPADAALCPIRVAMQPDGLEWRLWPMKFEESVLVPTAGNTVAYRETLFVESSSAHGSGPFWATLESVLFIGTEFSILYTSQHRTRFRAGPHGARERVRESGLQCGTRCRVRPVRRVRAGHLSQPHLRARLRKRPPGHRVSQLLGGHCVLRGERVCVRRQYAETRPEPSSCTGRRCSEQRQTSKGETKLDLFPVKIPFYREDRDTTVPVTQCNELCIVTLYHTYPPRSNHQSS